MRSPEEAFRWTSEPRLQRITAALQAGGEARFVGGCVRDSLLGQDPLTSDAIDIDIACDRTPVEMKALFDKAGIRWIATGEDHGTLTAVEGGMVAECTTLRADEETDGRHAEVRFTRDWDEDWRRRDFTINALYLSPDGTLHDPAGGLPDLERGRVRFIGDAGTRIEEDALRILRFFRFSARFAHAFDQEGLKAIAERAGLLSILSNERIWSELSRTFAAGRAPEAFRAAEAAGVLEKLLPGAANLPLFDAVHGQDGAMTPPLGAAALWPGRERVLLKEAFKPSTAFLDTYDGIGAARDALQEGQGVRELLYRFGRDASEGGVRLTMADGKATQAILDQVRSDEVPVLPYGGKDLLALGLKPGAELGRTLKMFEAAWIEAGLPTEEAACESLLRQVTA
ncbi:CCA tRNA nucleotidyltransferase [Parvularcula maris]|uniref:CCA tRNA nucleotidyltransferase n=1 Tax=Parvularcula maris TaxID=2965077 RepID=A0A9X2L9V2_9PROT|nr:CCA tRNA nucleotidyltransferase [Parvularcula maris]MCQ8185621.1 CCA tRNA nucleotidyltransferase [Parvularcula maris]